MSKELRVNSTVTDLAEFAKLFGPPPVLSTESVEAYETTISGFMRSLVPRDFVEQTLIRQIVDATWDIQRYQRHKSISIERKHREHIASEQRRKIALAERKSKIGRVQAEAAEVSSDIERLDLLEGIFDTSASDVGKIVNCRPEDLEYARAMEAGIDYQERLDRLLNAAYARKREALEQLEFYRTCLGRNIQDVSSEVIEGEFKEASVPSDEQQTSLVPKAGSK
jgi:hypothetical protein